MLRKMNYSRVSDNNWESQMSLKNTYYLVTFTKIPALLVEVN